MVAVVASVGLVTLLIQLAGARAVWDRMATMDWRWVGLAGGLSLLLPVLRGARFVATMPTVRLSLMTAVVGVQNFMARIMPFRTGELALPYLLGRHGAETSARAFVLLVWLRLMDAWLLAGLLAIGVVLHVGDGDGSLFWYALAAFAGFSVALFWLGAGLRLFFGGAVWALSRRGVQRLSAFRSLAEKVAEAADSVGALSVARRGAAVSWTLAVWGLQFVIFAAILRAYGADVSPLDVVVGVSLAQLAAALPLPSVGSVGTHEVGWVIGFGFVGLDRSLAVVSGVAAQVFTLVFAGCVALLSVGYLRRLRPLGEAHR